MGKATFKKKKAQASSYGKSVSKSGSQLTSVFLSSLDFVPLQSTFFLFSKDPSVELFTCF